VVASYDDITSASPEKSLMRPLQRTGGRNRDGKMTMRYIGGGHKKMYRMIDFIRNKDGMGATVKTIEYDPNRSARIALLIYEDGEKRYIIAPAGLKVGQQVRSGAGVAPEIGNCLTLGEIPLGTLVHNIELHPGKGGAMARSAGSYAQLTSRDGKFAIIKLLRESRMIRSPQGYLLHGFNPITGLSVRVKPTQALAGPQAKSPRWARTRLIIRGGGEGKASVASEIPQGFVCKGGKREKEESSLVYC
jgi:ribosomal protein L2